MKSNQKALGMEPKRKGLQKAMWNLIIDAAFAMILVYVLLNIGGFVNGIVANQITTQLVVATGGHVTTTGDNIINQTRKMVGNTTSGFSSNVNMMNIAITIGIVITPISMLLIFRRMST